jgi:hypothetical protein
MTLGVGVIFWFISHTMPCQPKGLGLHIYSWPRQPNICRDASLRCCPNHHAKDHKDQQYKIYFIILPLSLVRRLVGELDHPNPRAKLKELDPLKGLGEQIRKLVLDVDVARLEAPFLQVASDKMAPHPDVLAPFMKNGVLCQGQSGLAVHPEFHRSSVSAEEITKQSNKPESLSRSGGGCYVLGLAARQGHHLLLDRLLANEALAEEEEDPARALAGVDVASVVTVVVPNKVCLPRAPQVVEAVVESPCNIADDSLHSLLMLRRRSLHEPTNVADGECQVRPCVGEVAKAPHKTPVLRSIHLRRAVTAQLQSLPHRSENWVAVGEPSQLNDALGIGGLSKCDPGVALVHLDLQVGEKPQVTHLEGGLHLFLERCHLRILGAGDHQVIDVDTHQQGASSIAPLVDDCLVWTLPEAHSLERGVQLDIPRPRCLPQAIEGIAQAQHLALLARDRKSQRLMHTDLLL